MKNTFGNTISLTLFGESHGPAIGAVLDGLPPGLVIPGLNDSKKLTAKKTRRALRHHLRERRGVRHRICHR